MKAKTVYASIQQALRRLVKDDKGQMAAIVMSVLAIIVICAAFTPIRNAIFEMVLFTINQVRDLMGMPAMAQWW